jgi:type II secretory pathway component PulK
VAIKCMKRWFDKCHDGFVSFNRNEKGLALIFVLSLIGVIIALLGEILFQSQITIQTSVGESDRLRAEASALTGAQFAKLLVGMDAQLTQASDDKSKLPKEVKQASQGAKKMIRQQLGGKDISQMLDGFPIGAQGFESIKDLTKLNINALLDETLLKALKTVPGYFVLKTTNESGKFNLNLLEGSEKKVAFLALKRIFSRPKEAKFLDEKGFSPERLAANIMDYVDRDNVDEIDKGDEVNQYTKEKFNHKPKNARLESMEELRRIPGMNDDEIYGVFSPYFTVWPMDVKEKSIDVNAASVELLAALFTPSLQEVNQGEFDKIEDKRFEDETVTQERDLPNILGGAQDPESKQILSRLMGVTSTVYRVEVRGVSNNVERNYSLVIEAVRPKGGKKTPAAAPPVGDQTPEAAAAAATEAAPSASEGLESPVRVVYQRFQ